MDKSWDRFDSSEHWFNEYMKDLGRIGGNAHAGPMMQLKMDTPIAVPYTYQADLEPCVDCWVHWGGFLQSWAIKHDCFSSFK